MRKDDLVRLRHMLDAAEETMSFAESKDRADLEADRMLALALVKCIEIIGEAAAGVSKETQESYPQLPWAAVIGMRNRLIHTYFDINLDIVWSTVTQDIPLLSAQIEKIIGREQAS